MRSALVLLTMIVLTPPLAALVLLATALGVADKPGSVLWWAPRAWGRGLLRAAGVRVRVHGADRMGDGQTPRVFVSNHVSWFDVFALAATLPRYSFVCQGRNPPDSTVRTSRAGAGDHFHRATQPKVRVCQLRGSSAPGACRDGR